MMLPPANNEAVKSLTGGSYPAGAPEGVVQTKESTVVVVVEVVVYLS